MIVPRAPEALRRRGCSRGGEAVRLVAISAGPTGAGKHRTLISSFWPMPQKRFTVIASNTREFWTPNYLFTYENFNQ